jgi:hypothetical protein
VAPKKRGKIAITFNDGLPVDRLEQAMVERIQVESGVTSKFSALVRILGDAEAARAELERINGEKAEAAARAARISGAGVDDVHEAEEEPERSESSRRAVAAMKQQIGWNDKNAGRHSLRPKRGW